MFFFFVWVRCFDLGILEIVVWVENVIWGCSLFQGQQGFFQEFQGRQGREEGDMGIWYLQKLSDRLQVYVSFLFGFRRKRKGIQKFCI